MDSLQTKQFRKNEQISLKIEDLTEEGAGEERWTASLFL